MSQRKTGQISKKERNEMEASKLGDMEFKTLVIRMPQELVRTLTKTQ